MTLHEFVTRIDTLTPHTITVHYQSSDPFYNANKIYSTLTEIYNDPLSRLYIIDDGYFLGVSSSRMSIWVKKII